MFKKSSKLIVVIEGMSCDHCAHTVATSLSQIENITKVKVNLSKKEALISYTNLPSTTLIKETITSLGYKVLDIKNN